MINVLKTLCVVAVVALVLLIHFHSRGAALSVEYARCEQVCGVSAGCDTACVFFPGGEYEGVETTCGEFDGGADNGWCSYPECGLVCGHWTDGGTACNDGVENTDCYEFGYYLHCGDDVCALGTESESSCAADCAPPTVPEPEDEAEAAIWVDAAGEALASLHDGGASVEDGLTILSVLYAHGLYPEDPYSQLGSLATTNQCESPHAPRPEQESEGDSALTAPMIRMLRYWSCEDKKQAIRTWGLWAIGLGAVSVASGAAAVLFPPSAVVTGPLSVAAGNASEAMASATLAAAVMPCTLQTIP